MEVKTMGTSNAKRARERMISRQESGTQRPAMSYRKDSAELLPQELKERSELIEAIKRRWDRGDSDFDLVERLVELGVDVEQLNADYLHENHGDQAAKITEACMRDLRDAGYEPGTGARVNVDGKARSKTITRHGDGTTTEKGHAWEANKTGRQRFDGMASSGGIYSKGAKGKQTSASAARQRMINRSEGE